MTSRSVVLAVFIASACGTPAPGLPEACLQEEPIQLVPGRHDEVELARAGDRTYFVLEGQDDSVATYAGRGCGVESVVLAEGVRMLPTRIALDPRDDDPAYACDQDTARHYRVDLAGERPLELLLPDLHCIGEPSAYGPVFAGGWGGKYTAGWLRLLPDFPDAARAVAIREDRGEAVTFAVLDEWLVYTERPAPWGPSELYAYEFATGEVTPIPGDYLFLRGHGEHVLGYTSDFDADTVTATLIHAPTATATVFDPLPDQDGYDTAGFTDRGLDFSPDGAHIYRVPRGGTPAAFDLDGRPVALASPGDPLAVLAAGIVSVTRDDRRLYFAPLGDDASTALDLALDSGENRSDLTVTDAHVEKVVDGDLVRAPLDGGPVRTVATAVGATSVWLDEDVLVTEHDGTLERIDTATGERAHLVDHVTHWQAFDAGIYYIIAESPDVEANGLWYLPPAALDITPPAG